MTTRILCTNGRTSSSSLYRMRSMTCDGANQTMNQVLQELCQLTRSWQSSVLQQQNWCIATSQVLGKQTGLCSTVREAVK